MATSETTNLQLVKYGAGTDNFIRTDYNGNLDKIDTFAGDTNQAIATLQGFETVTDWNSFKPTDESTISRRQGVSSGGTATGSPFSGDSASFFGFVEGTSRYCTQHLTCQYANTATNYNRSFVRSYLGGNWTSWQELSTKSDISITTGTPEAKTGYNIAATQTLLFKSNGIVYFSTAVQASSGMSANTLYNVATIPDGFKPASGKTPSAPAVLMDNSGKNVQACRAYIDSNGLSIGTGATVPTGMINVYVSMTYYT